MLGLRSVFCVLCCSYLFGALAASSGILVDGESLAYRLYIEKAYMSIPAGTAQLTTTCTNGVYDLVLSLQARPVVETVYHFKTKLTSRVTPELRPLRYAKHAEEGTRIYDELTMFSYPADGGCRIDSKRIFADGRVRTNQIFKTESVYDLVSVVFLSRTEDWQTNGKNGCWKFPVATGLKVEDQILFDQGLEDVKKADGTVVKARTYCLYHHLPGAAAAQEEFARFWIADDLRRLPIRINLRLKFGTISVRAE